jgi:delta 1-pyrroline-5-carboxylate dehydrogenase
MGETLHNTLLEEEGVRCRISADVVGAMDELELGNPRQLSTDIGPTISAAAQHQIQSYVDVARNHGRLLKQFGKPAEAYFIGPAVIEVKGIEDRGTTLPAALFQNAAVGTLKPTGIRPQPHAV